MGRWRICYDMKVPCFTRKAIWYSLLQSRHSFTKTHYMVVPYLETFSGSNFSCWRKLGDRVQFMETEIDKTDLRRKLKEEQMQEVRERQRLEREEYKARKIPTPEDILVRKIELAKKKVAQTRVLLKKYDVPVPEVETNPIVHHAPEILTPEERHFWKKMGQKYKNYVPVGRRGIYGGTIQNMHLHWKKHDTVRVDCHMFSDEQIKVMAKDLARLSGGIVVDIRKDKVVVLYRGSKYKQPKELIPKNLLDKRKALKKSLLEQSMNSVLKHIGDLEKKRRRMQLEMALEVEKSSTVSSIALGDNTPRIENRVASYGPKEHNNTSRKLDFTVKSPDQKEEDNYETRAEVNQTGERKISNS